MGVDKSDWEWLVKEHFLSQKFKDASTRNSVNRSKLRMPHRTGSRPIREIVYEMGGKDGNPPNMATIFFETLERCFGPQCKSHVVGFGGGITTKELKGGTTSKAALWEELKTTRKEKESLQKRMDILESKYEHLENIVICQSSSVPSIPSVVL
ncbi:uncharacterized protein LOC125812047 [Solanum verrucosum]|uniref:uncharacterized protein LOC125812047 n=1 Tax=Solanum verrucosum TaxID=315347 RepID=UPI0020D14892|nr:uncharacterized protein LOC125812047 [Solanum verrucosum]